MPDIHRENVFVLQTQRCFQEAGRGRCAADEEPAPPADLTEPEAERWREKRSADLCSGLICLLLTGEELYT